VGTALARDERMNLVDDDRIDLHEPIACVRRQQQEQRFRCRDQNVCSLALELRPLGRRRVARPNRDVRNRHRHGGRGGGIGDSRKRRAQVAFDVGGERLQR